MSRSYASLNLPNLSIDESDTFENPNFLSQTFSREHLVSKPQETFSVAEDRNVLNAEELNDAFAGIYRDHAASACLDEEVKLYADASGQAGNMLHELGRQLENAGRKAYEIKVKKLKNSARLKILLESLQ